MSKTLEDARRSAAEAFARLGLPTGADEAWRYTSLAKLGPRLVAEQRGEGARVAALDVDGPLLAFVDGALDLDASRATPELRSLLAADGRTLDADLASLSLAPADGLSALNAMRFSDGALVRIPRRARPERPIQLSFTASSGASVHARNRVVIEAEASVDLLEHHVGVEGSVSEVLTEIVLGPGAELRYTRVADGGTASIGRVIVRHHEHSRFFATSLILGGDVTRAELDVHLADGARAELSGASLVDGERIADQVTLVRHETSRGASAQLYKAIVADRGVSTYYGKVSVAKDTRANDARQSSRNLLLSPRATANTRPELEIDAQDVQCSHGATVGRLDEAQVFYLRSRGVGEREARAMLTEAFAQEIVERIGSAAIRDAIAPRVTARIAELTRSRS